MFPPGHFPTGHFPAGHFPPDHPVVGGGTKGRVKRKPAYNEDEDIMLIVSSFLAIVSKR
jgi:hypothetical protein